VTKFGDAMRARFEKRIADRTGSPPAAPETAPGKIPVSGPPPASPSPPAARPKRQKKARETTPLGKARAQVKLLNRASTGGLFDEVLGEYEKKRDAAYAKKGPKRKDAVFKHDMFKRITAFKEAVRQVAADLLGEPVAPRVEHVWRRSGGKPKFRVRKEEQK